MHFHSFAQKSLLTRNAAKPQVEIKIKLAEGYSVCLADRIYMSPAPSSDEMIISCLVDSVDFRHPNTPGRPSRRPEPRGPTTRRYATKNTKN